MREYVSNCQQRPCRAQGPQKPITRPTDRGHGAPDMRSRGFRGPHAGRARPPGHLGRGNGVYGARHRGVPIEQAIGDVCAALPDAQPNAAFMDALRVKC